MLQGIPEMKKFYTRSKICSLLTVHLYILYCSSATGSADLTLGSAPLDDVMYPAL
jgi:hypothetical protein